jgi:hypothetical protein
MKCGLILRPGCLSHSRTKIACGRTVGVTKRLSVKICFNIRLIGHKAGMYQTRTANPKFG